MPGIADLLNLALGRPDPMRQLAQALAGQQPQQPPPDQQQPPQGPPPAGPPPAGGAGAPTPLTPGQTPPPGQGQPQPQALQSSPDMQSSYQQLANPPNIMGLYLQAQRQQAASDQFSHGLATLAAINSPPSMTNAIMQGARGGPDVAGQFGNLMQIYQMQQQMGAQQQLLGQAPAIAKKLGWDEGMVRAEIMAGRGPELLQDFKPTELQRNYDWARQTYAANHPDATPEEIDQGAQGVLLGAGGMGGGDADTKSWRMAKIQWDQNPATKGTPYPWGTGADDNPTRFRAYSGAQIEEEKSLATDQSEAGKLGPTYRQNLQGARERIASIIGLQSDGTSDPTRADQLKKLLGSDMAQKFINADPTKGTMDQDVASFFGGLEPEDKALLTQIRDATNPALLIGGLKQRAPKRGSSDVTDIGSNLDSMRNVTQGYDDWMKSAKGALKAVDTATMNSFGAQGTPEAAEDYALKHHMPVTDAVSLMDDSYLPGGKMYPKGKFSGAPMPQPQIDAAAAAIKNAEDPEEERQKQIKLALARGVDPKPLKDLRF